MEESNLRLLILFGYTAGVIFALIVIILMIYNYVVRPKIVIGQINQFRDVVYNSNYYDFIMSDEFNGDDLPSIGDYVKGYIQKFYQDEPRDVFVITELIKEPCTVD